MHAQGFGFCIITVAWPTGLDRAQPLDDPWQRPLFDNAVLISDDLKSTFGQRQQFTTFQKMIGIAWTGEAFISTGEGFVYQDPTGGQCLKQRCQQRSVQVIDDNNAIKRAPG